MPFGFSSSIQFSQSRGRVGHRPEDMAGEDDVERPRRERRVGGISDGECRLRYGQVTLFASSSNHLGREIDTADRVPALAGEQERQRARSAPEVSDLKPPAVDQREQQVHPSAADVGIAKPMVGGIVEGLRLGIPQ